jgi:hypothetical protein
MRRILIAILVASAAIALGAAPSEQEARKRIVDTAESFRGVPYVYGAESPEAFDCSGFVQYVYAHAADIAIPRNSRSQWEAGLPEDKSAAKPGDIFVFDTVGAGGPSHVAIFLGAERMIHAISEGPTTGVVVSPITDRYFAPRILGARYFIISAFPGEPAPAKPGAPKPEAPKPQPAAPAAPDAQAAPAQPAPKPQPAAPAAPAAQAAPVQPAPKPTGQPAPARPAGPATAAPPSASASPEIPLAQIGVMVRRPHDVVEDPIPAAAGTAIAFTITNATGKDAVFHIAFYKTGSSYTILREERVMLRAGASQELSAYTFTEPGIYRLNVKSADNTQMMQRAWKVVELKK